MVEENEGEEEHCCISHEFVKSASQNPNKIAVIHAYGGARICREFRRNITNNPSFNTDDYFHSHRASPPNPSFKGDQFFTFSDILASVHSLSNRINAHPRRPGDTSPLIVGIYMPPCVEYVVAVLSVVRCGEAAFLPLDPSWPNPRVLSIISSSKLALILTCESYKSECTALAEQSGCLLLEFSMEENHPDPNAECLVWPCQTTRQFCYLLHTSGSTGKPKAVCGTEAGLLNRYLWMKNLFPPEENDILLFKTSVAFVDHLQEFLSPVLAGVPLVIPPFEEFKTNPFYIADFSKAYGISKLILVPSVMRAILPAMQSPFCRSVQNSLKLLVFSGEVLSVSLWDALHKLLPNTSILNLYGSTEVSGDCTYFDCKRLPVILETELLSSVPIGMPISNCDVILVGEQNEPEQGEVYVGGICTSVGYFLDPALTSLDYVKLPQVFGHCNSARLYFKTGDFARRLHTGDLVFTGRKDRVLKVNGQRIALEEIENNLREHADVVDVAVIFLEGQGKLPFLIAFIVLRSNDETQVLESQIRNWLLSKLPAAMIPNRYLFIKSLPTTSTGKVDYAHLSDLSLLPQQVKSIIDTTGRDPGLLQVIKEAFCDALLIGEIKNDDDFFEMGGNSIGAAQVVYKLGIHMQLLYLFPSPNRLLNALQDQELGHKFEFGTNVDWDVKLKTKDRDKLFASSLGVHSRANDENPVSIKCLKVDLNTSSMLNSTSPRDTIPWISGFNLSEACSFSRCNKVVYEGKFEANDVRQAFWSAKHPRNKKGSVHEMWKVPLKSCVDASPLVVSKDGAVHLFIGSHSHIFLCVNAVSGLCRWEVKLEGRIECSAAIVDDFSQVVVGCYKGQIYFLDFMTGRICWVFATQGEVKSQPVADAHRKLIWCGSYDHNLYALDYRNHRCVYQVSCGGSIYGSPSINTVHNILCVASTMGRVTSILVEASPFHIKWTHELGAPVFGSLTSSSNGNAICCLVDGHVTVLSLSGSVVWKAMTGGPIFAGACLSYALPSQVLVCSRDGCVYSFDLQNGDLLWKYIVGDPITSSAYVDENTLISDPSCESDRLLCICSSSGCIYVLRVNPRALTGVKQPANVLEFARMELPGDIFSSPVMIGGRIFVGSRDDFVHCLKVD